MAFVLPCHYCYHYLKMLMVITQNDDDVKRSLIMIYDCEFVALFYYSIITNYNEKLRMNIVNVATSIKF